MDYRGIIDLLEMMTEIQDHLELEQIPHFTLPQINDLRQLHQRCNSFQKFLQTIRSICLDIILKKVIHIFYPLCEVILVTAIDSSGIMSSLCQLLLYLEDRSHWRSYLKTSVAGGSR